jgi:hypothetical protein
MKEKNGEIIFIHDCDEDGNKVEVIMCHPEREIEDYFKISKEKEKVCWKQYSGKIVTTKNIKVTAYKLSKMPHAVFRGNKWEYDTELFKEYIEQYDLRSNCLGFALADINIWLSAGREPDKDESKDIFEVILKNDGYTSINKDEIVPNSIAMFKKGNNYKHAAKTDDGVNWICKSGINKVKECRIEKESEKWGEVEYYKKLD